MDKTQNHSTFVVGLTRRKKRGKETKGMDKDRGKCNILSIRGQTILGALGCQRGHQSHE